MWLNSRRQSGALAASEVQRLTSTSIEAQPAALPADPSTDPPVQPPVAPIALKGPLWESNVAIFVKFKMNVPPTALHLIERMRHRLIFGRKPTSVSVCCIGRKRPQSDYVCTLTPVTMTSRRYRTSRTYEMPIYGRRAKNFSKPAPRRSARLRN